MEHAHRGAFPIVKLPVAGRPEEAAEKNDGDGEGCEKHQEKRDHAVRVDGVKLRQERSGGNESAQGGS